MKVVFFTHLSPTNPQIYITRSANTGFLALDIYAGMCCVNADTLRAHITRYSNSNTSPQRADAVDFNAVGSVPLARIVCEIFRIYAGLQLP